MSPHISKSLDVLEALLVCSDEAVEQLERDLEVEHTLPHLLHHLDHLSLPGVGGVEAEWAGWRQSGWDGGKVGGVEVEWVG